MKHRKLWIVLGIILLILIVAAVAVRVFLLRPIEVDKLEGVQLRVLEGFVTRESLRCIVENQTGEAVELAPSHSWIIEQKGLFGWRQVLPKPIVWFGTRTAEVWVVRPGEGVQWVWDWSRQYGRLSPGTYRLRVEFKNSKWLAAEFVIP